MTVTLINRILNRSLIEKNVAVISRSRNIYENLALEDWFYSKCEFSSQAAMLLMWIDDPCVVIGRHQNPWTEVNIANCEKHRIKISRRHSGGGTVFHDMGNINFSFLTRREDYDRRRNLQTICNFLDQEYGIETEISKREDLILRENGAKISGTASKLARINSYHHCTLLVDVNMEMMRLAIRSDSPAVIMSRATKSVRSKTANLSNLISGLDAESVMHLAAKSFSPDVLTVSPDEQTFPDLNERIAMLSSWEWIYGKTPCFTARIEYEDSIHPIDLSVTVRDGKIEMAQYEVDGTLTENLFLKDCLFTREAVTERLSQWAVCEDDHLLISDVWKATEILFDRIL